MHEVFRHNIQILTFSILVQFLENSFPFIMNSSNSSGFPRDYRNEKITKITHLSEHYVDKTEHGKKTYDSEHYEKNFSFSTHERKRTCNTKISTFTYNEEWNGLQDSSSDSNSQTSFLSKSDLNSCSSSTEMPLYEKFARDIESFRKDNNIGLESSKVSSEIKFKSFPTNFL